MELDGDEPPALVDVSEQQETDARVDGQDHIASQVQDMTLNKVPLTLITGKLHEGGVYSGCNRADIF